MKTKELQDQEERVTSLFYRNQQRTEVVTTIEVSRRAA
eukprot:CAMPEP_0194754468 /NCGR_PEP_ID=MMETSP0323_2-20130528/8439_1 /TAXON_ID=2866 ORGANISM="Crypthecodinium cohnii, Strain Seligo" /NCGR_SAMPLE_ID=MMETSP0323_2 /ASSEMBLY_ACC=CAM_ASM_000346 /LENGTH=37 /DNA_ID= /DNA_START= /DNA_END= /DNA_ORIENTATION=